MTTKEKPEVSEDEQSFGEIVENIIENTPVEPRPDIEKAAEGKDVERNGVKYSCQAVRHKGKNVGFAPAKTAQGKSSDDQLEWLTNKYGSKDIVACFTRQLKQDVMNAVRAKYSKDKVSATTVINAIGNGTITVEMQQKAVEEMAAGKYKTFTDACAAYLGIGEGALKNADPKHIHWDCAK